MSVFKCKMCGGTIEFEAGATVGICDSCGTKQTLPKTGDDNIANLFNRANNLRLKCEFDRAAAIYEKIVEQDDSEAEAHWGIILCKYGIEYVDDPKTGRKIPTCHRTLFDAVTADDDYKAAIDYSDVSRQILYEAEAREIDRIQKDIISIVKNEKPFDVFICYKETDENGRRTQDSVIANDIYYQLTEEGFKVFYAAITLEDKLGQEYEPYIFAALSSAKVMLVVGTDPLYFNSVWVRNEWSRFIKLMKTDRSKLLIPCYRDMDAYELPEEFAHLQAQDMSKIGFINDVVRGIKKVISDKEPTKAAEENVAVNTNNSSTASLLEKAFLFLEDGNWNDANIYCEKVLDIDPKNAEAYLGKLMAELQVKTRKQLADCAESFEDSENYNKILRFGDEKLEAEMRRYVKHIKEQSKQIVEAIRTAFEKKISEKHCAYLQGQITELTDLSAMFDEKLSEIDITKDETAAIAEEIQRLQNKRNSLGFFSGRKKEINRKIDELTDKAKGLEEKSQNLKEALKGYVSKASVDAEIDSNRKQLETIHNQIKENNTSTLELSFDQALQALKDEKVKAEFEKKYENICENDVLKIYFSNVLGVLKFGSYPQDENGQSKTPILWQVLAKEKGKILIISDKALDCQRYNTLNAGVTWETCTLRNWLNNTFLNAAFSAEEQSQILNTTVSADKNPNYSTNPGNATTDKVFLLSITEAEKYFSSNEDRKCLPTEYAKAQGAYTNGGYTKGGEATCWWWLRSPGYVQDMAAVLHSEGSVGCSGSIVYHDYGSVRPAMWISSE